MKKELFQIIKEAATELPEPELVSSRFWKVNVDDGNGNLVTVNFIKFANVWHFTL